MRRYIVTGAPGSGKTAIVRALLARGYAVVDEAATDVLTREQQNGVAEPWREPGFLDAVIRLQQERQQRLPADGAVMQVFDQSPICTLTLARYCGLPITRELRTEVNRVVTNTIYQPAVFFVQHDGKIEPTVGGWCTTPDDAERFEELHRSVYQSMRVYELVDVPPMALEDRVDLIDEALQADEVRFSEEAWNY
ncbi:AAA family ATPase [Cryptosporangium phraense]|uniref:AAA family ATPase n=1 Tax=Cryptosporangium phraense TaxID=2593070 RepID=A0A545B0E2_9ACTN|nr:AAA family ATPase [Cryptosporangium phraense]TQS47042.1 AAA family ATPase [Cryptosporangium phraense]